MTKQTINVGSGEYTGDGESLRAALVKTNENFDEVYTNINIINAAGYITTNAIPTNVGDFVNNVNYVTEDQVPAGDRLTSNGIEQFEAVLDSSGTLNVPGNIIPGGDGIYSLGSPTNKFKDLYVSTNTIYIGEAFLGIGPNNELTVSGNPVTSRLVAFSNFDCEYIIWNTGTNYVTIQNPNIGFILAITTLQQGNTFKGYLNDLSFEHTFTVSSEGCQQIDSEPIYRIGVTETHTETIGNFADGQIMDFISVPYINQINELRSGEKSLSLTNSGEVIFPDGSTQTTAYTGSENATDRISSGTSALVISEDNAVTFPTLTTMSDTTASVVFNMADAVISSIIDYSTTSTDFIDIGVYGNADIINAPYAVTEFTFTPEVNLLIGDIVSGAGYDIPSYIIHAGTGTLAAIVVTDSDFSNYPLPKFPQPGHTVTIARPMETLAFNIQAPANTSILINPGSGGNIVMSHDLIPLEDNVQSLGSVLNRWKHLWISGGSIFIKDIAENVDVGITAESGLLKIIGSAGLNVGEFTFQDNQIIIADNSRDIVIGTTTATAYVQFNRPVKMNNSGGQRVFEITRDGLVTVFPKQDISVSESALSIIGNAAGVQQPRNFTGTMLQITGQNGISTRVSIDAFGTGAYPLIAGRAARGTVQAPTAVKNKDILLRFSTQGYGDNQYVQSIGRITVEATQDFTNATAGTQVVIQTTPNGSNVITTSTIFNDQGIDFDGNTNGGITFYDRSRQTSAFTGTMDVSLINNLGTVAVTEVIAGVGLSGGGLANSISLDNTGVLTVAGTADQISVNGNTTATNGNITLSLPQNIAPTSNVTFNDVNINGQLNFLSSSTILIPNTVEGTQLILGSTATNVSEIDSGGIVLGNTTTGIASILWNRASNYWDFDGSGINTQQLIATNSTFTNVNVINGGRFGIVNEDNIYSGALIQVDNDINSYGQVLNVNHNPGTQSSADIVAVNDIGTDESYFIDMGINSSNYNTSTWKVNGANDGYLYVQDGNLAIGTTQDRIVFFTNGTLAGNIEATITANGLNVVSTVTSAGFYGPLTGNVTGDVTGSVSGNAGSVTNGVYLNSSYNNPSWITGLAGSKITSAVGTATTVVNGIYNTDTGTVTNNMLAGGIANNKLSFNQITFTAGAGIGVSVASPSLGGSTTISNTGVTSITTGSGIIISTSSGNIVISAAVPQGPIGYTGSTGTQGLVGYTGSTGTQGVIGYTGSTGTQGVIGYTGSTGTQGVIGYTGSTGTQGVIGYTGSTGTQGVIGYTGSTGTQGVIGYTGSTGTQGVIGYTGSRGVADVYVSSISAGTGTTITTSTGAVTMYIGQAVGTNNDVTFNSVSDVAGNLRSIPIRSTSTSYTLTSADNGQVVSITTGSVTVPANVFASPYGQTISIYNNTVTTMSVLAGANVTLRLAGTLSTGTRTLARYGIASVMAVSSNTFVISGAGLA